MRASSFVKQQCIRFIKANKGIRRAARTMPSRQRSAGMPRNHASLFLRRPLLLVSDLDDTLLPGAHSAGAREADSKALRMVLIHSRFTCTDPLRIVVNTGRTMPLFEEVFASRADLLPSVDAVITGVGTRIYYPRPPAADGGGDADGGLSGECYGRLGGARGGGWEEYKAWASGLRAGGWDRGAVAEAVEGLARRYNGGDGDSGGGGGDGDGDSGGGLCVRWQRAAEQHEFKATFLYAAELQGALQAELESALSAAGVKATIIEGAAADPAWRFIDVLPAGAGKGAAMEHVRARFGFAPEDTVAAGDGANDLLMLRAAAASGAAAVVVGNAQPEVKAWALQAAAQAGGGGDGGGSDGGEAAPRVYLAPPNAPAAAGVLQGLVALGFFKSW